METNKNMIYKSLLELFWSYQWKAFLNINKVFYFHPLLVFFFKWTRNVDKICPEVKDKVLSALQVEILIDEYILRKEQKGLVNPL